MSLIAKLSTTIVLSATIVFFADEGKAQLPPVTVYGNYSGGSSSGDGFSFGGGEPFSGYSIIIAGLSNYEAAHNVRCLAGGDLRNVTSQSAFESRWMAAEQVYRLLLTYRTFFERWTNINPLVRDGFFRVIYSDGGSETWMIISPAFSSVTAGLAKKDSLKPGDGKVQKHVLCG